MNVCVCVCLLHESTATLLDGTTARDVCQLQDGKSNELINREALNTCNRLLVYVAVCGVAGGDKRMLLLILPIPIVSFGAPRDMLPGL